MIKSFFIFNLLISSAFSQSQLTNNSYWPWTLPSYSLWPSNTVFQSLRSSISGNVIIKGDSNYSPHTWNGLTNTPKPAVIIQPLNSNDIIVALKFAKQYSIRVSVQSTGHHQDHRNIQDNSILIDMSTMNSLSYNSAQKTLTTSPGNTFATIQTYVSTQTNKAYVALGGADPSVGIYGWTVGGGHGALTRLYGLGVDALISVDLIIANFTVITASATQNQALFRALRGSGGGAYGIAISLTVQLYADPGTVSTFTGNFPLTTAISTMFANWIASAPNYASAYFIPNNYGSLGSLITISAQCFSSSSTCSTVLSTLQTGCTSSCYLSLDKYSHYYDFIIAQPQVTSGTVYLTSTALNANNILAGLNQITSYIKSNSFTGCSANAVLGGASSTIDLTQTNTCVSTEMRTSIMAITCYSMISSSDSSRTSQVAVMDYLGEYIMKTYSTWVYWNEPQRNFPSNDWQQRYWGSNITNYNSLLAVKNQYDPYNFFTCYHCIGYVRYENEDPDVCPGSTCTCSNTPYGVCNSSLKVKLSFIFLLACFILNIQKFI